MSARRLDTTSERYAAAVQEWEYRCTAIRLFMEAGQADNAARTATGAVRAARRLGLVEGPAPSLEQRRARMAAYLPPATGGAR